MIVDWVDLKGNLEKYIYLSTKEEIVVVNKGKKVAKLSAYEEDTADNVREQASLYEFAPRKASYEEFLALVETSEHRYEYIEGEIYLLSSPKIYHQKILGELHFIFYSWFQGKKCRPMFAPFDITLKRSTDDINVVQPDLLVICDLEEKANEKNYYIGVPTLVVEIVSESTRSKDSIKKLDLYMTSRVKEYWIVNPLNREVCIYLFEENNISKSTTYKNRETAASCYFPGLEVSLAIIFA